MKKVLITGENGFVGSELNSFLEKTKEKYTVRFISLRSSKWEQEKFNDYDAIIHLAGIAHTSRKKKDRNKYYEINTDLTEKLAKKAKKENVSKFIFLSSIIVYGNAQKIDGETVPKPIDFYGDSKLRAEEKLIALKSTNFSPIIIRSPLIYGNKVKGNFSKILNLSKKTIVFPDIKNKRSMIYIENLCNLIKICIERDVPELIHPQNENYICTSNLVRCLAKHHKHKIIFLKFPNILFKKIINNNQFLSKIFGDLYYDVSLQLNFNYNLFNLNESIKKMVEDSEINE